MVGAFALGGGFCFAIPGADEGQSAEFHFVGGQSVLELGGIAEITHPIFAEPQLIRDLQDHGLDAGETALCGDFNHVAELVVIALAGFLHEPGVDFRTEFDV